MFKISRFLTSSTLSRRMLCIKMASFGGLHIVKERKREREEREEREKREKREKRERERGGER